MIVSGAKMGNVAQVSFDKNTVGLLFDAQVLADNNVVVRITTLTSAQQLGSLLAC